jgi:hypothetical protein
MSLLSRTARSLLLRPRCALRCSAALQHRSFATAPPSSTKVKTALDGMTCAAALSKDQMEAVVCSRRYKTWLYLCTNEAGDVGLAEDGMAMLEAAHTDGAIELVHLPLLVDHLTVRDAHEIFEAVQDLPKPIFISCNNALRSHAVKVLCEALTLEESSDETFARIAKTKSRGLLKSPHIVQWLIASIDG